MNRAYVQLSHRIQPDIVVKAMKAGFKTIPVIGLDGKVLDISIASTRMLTYTKGTSCVNCGKEGHFFIAERDKKDRSTGHLNLYHKREDGSLVMMTSDHIIPKSKGGDKSNLKNRQPMCCYCNFRKGDLLPGEVRVKKEKIKDNSPSRARSCLALFLKLTSHLNKGMSLEKYFELRANLLYKILRLEHKLSDEEKLAFRKSSFLT